ncbi:MFS transporter [Spirillospora sp. NPDC048911]|uniref:MFS transporter n=1 Tax=Spirillospora sp. NPDC048911 TaxID=3364527 RepID=UPI003714BC9D
MSLIDRPVAAPVRRPHDHRAWWIVAVAATAIMAAGAFGTLPGLLVAPLHHEFGWSHGTTGLAMWVNMALNGLIAPFAAALMERFGPRRIAAAALLTIAAGAALTTVMTAAWQFTLYWGVLIGLGTGAMGGTFATVVTNRWFVRRRGLATGILTASGVFGQFVFLPPLAWVVEHLQWRAGTVTLAMAALVVVPLAWFWLRDHPSETGTTAGPSASPSAPPRARPFQVLRGAARTRTFWLLAGTFAICGISTNGLMWTHFVPAAGDHGMAPTTAASMLTLIGIFNVAGTVASGWLTDRYDARLLLAVYYTLRAGTLFVLPQLLGPSVHPPLIAFIILFGLLDVATIPPTIALSAIRDRFGTEESAVVFGWTLAAHQLGAGLMALAGGLLRDALGTYTMVWIFAGLLCLVAALMSALVPAPAPGAEPRAR